MESEQMDSDQVKKELGKNFKRLLKAGMDEKEAIAFLMQRRGME